MQREEIALGLAQDMGFGDRWTETHAFRSAVTLTACGERARVAQMW
jgi:hypothetical protein